MAGSVLKRTCFYDRTNGTIRPHEWCVIIHSDLGPMVEPFWPFGCNMNRIGGSKDGLDNDDFSTDNTFQRVDEFIQVDDAQLVKSLNFGEGTKWMHGGRHYPRKGR